MALIIAIALVLILGGMLGTESGNRAKANKVMAQKNYPDNQALENEIKNHLYEEFGKISRNPDYTSPDIPLEYQSFYRSYHSTEEDVYLFVEARTKDVLFSQGYKPFVMSLVCSYNVLTKEITDETDPERIYGLFNSKVLPKIREFNNDYTEEEIRKQKESEEYISSITKIQK